MSSLVLEGHARGHVGFGPAVAVLGPALRQVQPPVHQGLAPAAGVAEEDAHLAVVDLAEPAAPLPLHAAGGGAALGEAAAVQDQHAVGVADLDGDVAPQLVQDRFVVPLAGADEVLHRLAMPPGLAGDGLGGLALQVAELAGEDDGDEVAVFPAEEAGQVALQEPVQALGPPGQGRGRDVGLAQQFLGLGVLEQGHPCPSVFGLFRAGRTRHTLAVSGDR